MKRLLVSLAAAAGCIACAAGGYWLGFREAWTLSSAAEALPRAAVAAHQLNLLRTGRPGPVVAGMEFEVDKGLTWSDEVFSHPLRDLLGPLWGLDVYPGYERYAVLLANYRRKNPSLLNPDAFDKNPGLQQGARETKARIDRVVERYARDR